METELVFGVPVLISGFVPAQGDGIALEPLPLAAHQPAHHTKLVVDTLVLIPR